MSRVRFSFVALALASGFAAAISAVGSRAQAQIEVAGDLLVELDAADPSAGTPLWVNTASDPIGDFIEVGDPVAGMVADAPAVTFNATAVLDAYQCENPAPEGLLGPDPTRSIEVWAYNPSIASEETILAWGRRGGPNGTNMSFNYGTHALFGAVGHWGGDGPDLGWNNAGGAPEAGQWHHLVYTYDGMTTRVYADGCVVDEANCEANSEFLGPGAINTHPDIPVTLAAQIEPDGLNLNVGLRGTLSLGRIRIHDGVLTPAQIQNNYDEECPEFCPQPNLCECLNCPLGGDTALRGSVTYVRQLRFGGFPPPTSLAVTQPAGATITAGGRLSYTLPDPEPASFNVTVQCTNVEGTANFSWTVTLVDPVPRGPIQIAGELLVELDARAASAGAPYWLNSGTLGDFGEVGDAMATALGPLGSEAVLFNQTPALDAYECVDDAPAGIVGLNPTRSIEVWAFNPDIASEETLVSWGRRGGPNGTNMSFNYGTHNLFGAVGHWGGDGPDLGWNNAGGAPLPGEWHHLVYTYDGTTTRVYADGLQANSEFLGAGTINTFSPSKIVLVAQIEGDGRSLNEPLRGTLALGQVRVHDDTLTPTQVFQNFAAERERYGTPLPPTEDPVFVNAPADDTYCAASSTYTFRLQVTGSPPPSLEAQSPPGAMVDAGGVYTFPIPQPAPASFEVRVRAFNGVAEAIASWFVDREDIAAVVQSAGDLFVDLDARDPSAGTASWINNGALADFVAVGAPTVVRKGGIPAVSFNEDGRSGDAYQSQEEAPPGLVGPDPTRTIEVWVWNDAIANEETLVAWGRRGGPAGTNMSFNYGTNAAFGAIGHWDAPDIGWGAIPAAGQWHLLTYTFDGDTTRVFDNGVQTNTEELGLGVINTHAATRITLAAQIEPDGITLNVPLQGTLAISRVRVHDGVLSPCQVLSNYLVERDSFALPPCPTSGPDFGDTHCLGFEVMETGAVIGASHTVTATAVDDTGDDIFYTFRAEDGVLAPVVFGPTTQRSVSMNLRSLDPKTLVFTVSVDDRLDCDDAARDATCGVDIGGPLFVRGDADTNGTVELTDAVRILNFLFLGIGLLPCGDAADADDNGQHELTDAVRILNYLFLGTGRIPAPTPSMPRYPVADCGEDPTEETVPIGCETTPMTCAG